MPEAITVERLEGQPSREEAEPLLAEKILLLHDALVEAEIPHALGGGHATAFYRRRRTTIDIDMAIFVTKEKVDSVLKPIRDLTGISWKEKEKVKKQIKEHDQAVTHWGRTRIDLFFSVGEFHDTVQERVVEKDIKGRKIPVISAEDIIIFKSLFGRSHDWADIEEICEAQGDALDLDYLQYWLELIPDDDGDRVRRVTEVYRKHTAEKS